MHSRLGLVFRRLVRWVGCLRPGCAAWPWSSQYFWPAHSVALRRPLLRPQRRYRRRCRRIKDTSKMFRPRRAKGIGRMGSLRVSSRHQRNSQQQQPRPHHHPLPLLALPSSSPFRSLASQRPQMIINTRTNNLMDKYPTAQVRTNLLKKHAYFRDHF